MQSVLLYSIDSFFGALGIGLLDRSKSTKRKLILAFAVCDLCATLVGSIFRMSTVQVHPDSFALTASLAIAAVAAAGLARLRKMPGSLMWIPVLLSVDNFYAGLSSASVHGLQSSLICGLLSGLLAFSGFAVAQGAGTTFSRHDGLLAGVGLTIIALVFAS